MPLTSSTLDADEIARRIADLQRVVEAHQKRAHQHLQLAAKVHRSLLPMPVRTDRIEIDVRYMPVEEVGGDYCQVRFLNENVCYITICDVTGGLQPTSKSDGALLWPTLRLHHDECAEPFAIFCRL